MVAESNNKSSTDGNDADQSVSFQDVKAVASGWIFDFKFVSLCRHFKDEEFEDFSETLMLFEILSQSPSLKADIYAEKTMICAFIARVMHGKHLDSQFEEDDCVMPLVSAAKIWSNLEVTVADESVFKNIAILLFVQSVAVCLEKGQQSSASSALKWFIANYELPQNLKEKLSSVVSKRKTDHPLLLTFSFNNLLEAVKSFLDTYLQNNPSDNILKEATKMVLSSRNSEETTTKDKPLSESGEKVKNLRTKRKLMSTKMTDLWQPDSCKKLCVSIRRLSNTELPQFISEESMNTTEIHKKRGKKQKWTLELDSYLISGVDRHGPGKWSRILLDYDFNGRTGTMLKDRWRVLQRSHVAQ